MSSTSPEDDRLNAAATTSAIDPNHSEHDLATATESANTIEPVPESQGSNRTLARLNYALGPIGAGMMIDAVDFITYGPIGLVLGLPVGAAAGYWLGRSMRLESHMCWFCALVAGIYCTIPGTELLPLGTLVGALVRFQDDDGVSD